MNPDHFAIVMGLSRYPRLGDPPPADLLGPENDADAVYAWLTNPTEGGLPPENVKLIKSVTYGAPPAAAPTRDELEKTFLWLDELADANQKQGKHRTVGTRLYLYASGHGFSPRFRQGCLLAGDAAQRQYSANVFPSAWIDWLQDAEYFREFVLWMDCCMDRVVLTQPSPPPLDPLGGSNAPPGPSFIAFAATRPLKAVEKPIPADANRVHGVFTWNLLQGLRGAAANAFGIVTGRSLADWLVQAQLGWLDSTDLISPDVAKEPSIVDPNDRLIFARGLRPMEFDVTLRVDGATADTPVRLWAGTPPRPGPVLTLASTGSHATLSGGLYVAEGTTSSLRHGFSVTASREVVLREIGQAPREAPGVFNLTVDPADPTAEITLVGDGFRSIDTGPGKLQSQLPYGLYQMRIRIGRQIAEKVILLDSDWPLPAAAAAPPKPPGSPGDTDTPISPPPPPPSPMQMPAPPAAAPPPPAGPIPAWWGKPSVVQSLTGAQRNAGELPALPSITTAIPLPHSRTTHEYHEAAVAEARSRIDVQLGTGGQLAIMARVFDATGWSINPPVRPLDGLSDPNTSMTRRPWDSVSVLDTNLKSLADLSSSGQSNIGPGGPLLAQDPFRICSLSVAPGQYILRHVQGPIDTPTSVQIAHCLTIPPGGWRVEAYLLWILTASPSEPQFRVSVAMRRIGSTSDNEADDMLLEKARVALADERPVMSDDLSQLLLLKFDNPLAGIIGGHLLLLDHEHTGRPLNLLNTVVNNLRALVGPNHPDVEALSLECPDVTLRATRPFYAIPMFERSWKLILKASLTAPHLLPLSLWDQIHVKVVAPPFLMWAIDADTRKQFRRALAEAIFQRRPSLARAAQQAAKTTEEIAGDVPVDLEDMTSKIILHPTIARDASSPSASAPNLPTSVVIAPRLGPLWSVTKPIIGVGSLVASSAALLWNALRPGAPKPPPQPTKATVAVAEEATSNSDMASARSIAADLDVPAAALEALRAEYCSDK